jgi:hypothetical protein
MSDKPISDLRRRMIADMTVRSFSDKTQRDYIRHVETFAKFVGRSPDTASSDDCRRPIKMSLLCQLQMTLPWGFPGGVWGDGSANERWGVAASRGLATLLHGSAAVAGQGSIGAGWNPVNNRKPRGAVQTPRRASSSYSETALSGHERAGI